MGPNITDAAPDAWASRKRVTFADLVNPHHRCGDYTSPYSGEIYFGMLRWMVAAASKADAAYERRGGHRTGRWATTPTPVLDLLAGGSRYPRDGSHAVPIYPAWWLAYFRQMFDRVLLGGTPACLREIGVGYGETRVVPARHRVHGEGQHKGSPDITDSRISALADYVGRRTRLSYNDCHPKATEVCRVYVAVSPTGFSLYAHLDYPDDGGGSSWVIPTNGAYQKRGGLCGPTVPEVAGEAFGEFLDRAHATMERILLPSDEVNWYVFTVCRDDAGNAHRGARPMAHRPEAYVLAPTEEAALDFWRRRGRVGKDVKLTVTNKSGRSVARLPAEALKRVSAVRVIGGGAKLLDGFSPKNHDADAVTRALLAASRAPYRSQPHVW